MCVDAKLRVRREDLPKQSSGLAKGSTPGRAVAACAPAPGAEEEVAEEVPNDEFNANNNMNNRIIFPDAESAPKRP